MSRRYLTAFLGLAMLFAAGAGRAEDIPIPLSSPAPEETPSSPPTGDYDPAPRQKNDAINTPAYPAVGDSTPAPSVQDAGAGMAPQPGAETTVRKRPALFNSVKTERKVVALTYDDGPHGKLTPQLLDILKKENVRATFFVLGSLVEAHPEIVRRMAAEGHEVANHTWDHPRLPSLSSEKLDRQIRDTTAVIEKHTGQKVTMIRPTYGLYNERVKNELLGKHKLDIILWSVDPNDWKKPGANTVARRLIEGAHPGAILLAHDIHPGTIAATPKAIAGLKAKGYEFVTVSELLAMDAPPAPSPTPAEMAKKREPGSASETGQGSAR